MLKGFLLTFIPIVVAMDPLGLVPLFLGLCEGMDAAQRRRVIRRTAVTAAIAGLAFIVIGRAIFDFLHITAYDFQVAGGLVLLVLSLADILGAGEKLTQGGDPGVMPLGVPLVSGPAVLTTLILMVDLRRGEFSSIGAMGFTALAFALSLGLLVLCLALADRIAGWLGKPTLKAMGRIMDLLLAAIAVMMIRYGVLGIIAEAARSAAGAAS